MPVQRPAVDLFGLDAAIFDLDGVITRTASVHARAWKNTFDAFLQAHAQATGVGFVPFDINSDYLRYVDGMPRSDGVRRFLESRGIEIPEGDEGDTLDDGTLAGIAAHKTKGFLDLVASEGVETFDTTIQLIRRLRARGVATAVVSASRNCVDLLEAAGIVGLFDARVDGNDASRKGLPGKPRPDTFLEAARLLRVAPERAAVIEDAIAGVEAGRAGGFALVIGVDRSGQADALRAHGAHRVVADLGELLAEEGDV